MAVLAGIAEAGGGILLAFGLLTPLACTAIAIVMLNAIFAVTLKRAFLLGSELELMYLVTVVSLASIGPGRFSLDRAIGWDDSISGVWWGVLVFGAAAAASFATLALFHRKPPAQAAAAA
jgi:putative oxidoreductase